MGIKNLKYNHYFVEAQNNKVVNCKNAANSCQFTKSNLYQIINTEMLDEYFLKKMPDEIANTLDKYNKQHHKGYTMSDYKTNTDIMNLIDDALANFIPTVKLIIVPNDGYKITLSSSGTKVLFDLTQIKLYNYATNGTIPKNYHILDGIDLASNQPHLWHFM